MGPSHCRSVASAAPNIGLRCRARIAGLVALLALAVPNIARADEGGVGFWLPGQLGRLPRLPAGVPVAVGFVESLASALDLTFATSEYAVGKFNPTAKVNLNLGLSATPDLVLVAPTYVFATPVLGGQFAAGVGAAAGRSAGDLNGTLTAFVGPLSTTRQGEISDARYGFSDLYPQVSLRWNSGVNSWMVYAMGDIPVGTYDSTRLANLGIGHGAADSGVGYTYFDPKTGHEFSRGHGTELQFRQSQHRLPERYRLAPGLGRMATVSQSVQIGLVGYFYQQVTADSGAPAFLGENLSRVAGVGPQMGSIFPAGSLQGYLNLKLVKLLPRIGQPAGTRGSPSAFSPTMPTPPDGSRRMLTK